MILTNFHKLTNHFFRQYLDRGGGVESYGNGNRNVVNRVRRILKKIVFFVFFVVMEALCTVLVVVPVPLCSPGGLVMRTLASSFLHQVLEETETKRLHKVLYRTSAADERPGK